MNEIDQFEMNQIALKRKPNECIYRFCEMNSINGGGVCADLRFTLY